MSRLMFVLVGFLFAVLVTQSSYAVDWITVTGDGKFTVQMPSVPKEETVMVATEIGQVPMHIYTSAIGDDFAYLVFYSDLEKTLLSRTTPQKFLQSGQDGAVKKTKTTLRNSQQIQLGRWPGVSFVADNAQFVYTSNTYLVDNRLYQLVVVSKNGASNEQPSAKFFASFNVTDN